MPNPNEPTPQERVDSALYMLGQRVAWLEAVAFALCARLDIDPQAIDSGPPTPEGD